MLLRKFILLLAFLLPLSAMAEEDAADVRGFSWGDSLKHVVTHEKAPIFKAIDNAAPLYKTEFLGIDTVIGYTFSKDKKLTGAAFVFKTEHADKNNYFKDFAKVTDWLTEKYGKPSSEKRLWDSQQNKDAKAKDETKWGEALGEGQMSLSADWMTDKSYITHSLEKVNSDIVHIVSFSDKASIEEKNPEEKKPEEKKTSQTPPSKKAPAKEENPKESGSKESAPKEIKTPTTDSKESTPESKPETESN